MLTRVRLRTKPIAAALLVSLLSLNLPHVGDAHHDPDGAVLVFAHDASAHRVGSSASDDGTTPLHCVVCHVSRSFRLRSEATPLPAPIVETGTLVQLEISTAARTAPVAQPPLRSPPASPADVLLP